jgi:hypothetical protein
MDCLLQIRGCWFHQKQSIQRNIRDKGLWRLASTSGEFKHLLQLLYVLPFVPANDVSFILYSVAELDPELS